MWLVYALVTFLAWGAADLFYKKSADPSDRYSHLKTTIVVGLVMGITGIVNLAAKQIPYDFRNLLVYLPVSLMYILSMAVGYFGLRYLNVSVSSPIQNASGAVSAVLLMIVLKKLPDLFTGIAIVLVTAGVILLGVAEREQALSEEVIPDRKHISGFRAILIPVVYCVIDALGTFFDGWFLDDVETTPLIGVTEETLEDVANISYQLTFLIVALLLLLYLVLFRREKIVLKRQKDSLFAALFETGGQLTYVYALSGNGVAAAPVIGSYCVFSLILGCAVLKERLNKKQGIAVGLVIAGIVIMGILEGIETL